MIVLNKLSNYLLINYLIVNHYKNTTALQNDLHVFYITKHY